MDEPYLKSKVLFTKALNTLKDTISLPESDVGSELNFRKKIKYGTKKQAAVGIFSEYCENSTVHGLKYLGEPKRPILERIFWALVFIVSIYICCTLIVNVWNKWNNNPVIVSLAERSTPVWEIPFPAVTICPETKSRRRMFNYTEIYWKLKNEELNGTLTEQEKYYLEAIGQICVSSVLADLSEFGKELANGSKLIQAMVETAPIFEDTYICLSNKYPRANDLCKNVRKIITEEGVCYSYNTLNPKDIYREETVLDGLDSEQDFNDTVQWNLEDGYDPKAGVDTHPFRVIKAGIKTGLMLLLRADENDDDSLCRGSDQGFKLTLHTPGDVPLVSQQFFRIPYDQRIMISVKPRITTTSQGLMQYHPKRRQCFFQEERYLRYFKEYTQNNCELECLSNYTMRSCGCVQFFMPRNIDTPVCGLAKMDCIHRSEDNLFLEEFNFAKNLGSGNNCSCLPACTSVVYESEISQAHSDYSGLFKALQLDEIMEGLSGTRISPISVFLKEAQFLTYKRSELYGVTDFLANCGGLLGLFIGVSTISFVELVYFLSVRLIVNLRMRKKKRLEIERLQKDGEVAADAGRKCS